MNIDQPPGSKGIGKGTNEMNEQLENTPEIEPYANTYPNLDGEDTAVEAGDESEENEESEEGGEGFSAPEEYVEREKGERRRVGSDVKIEDINYKNVPLLSRFLDRRGRIMSRRKTRVSAKMQRRIVREVKRARHLALLPYTADQTRQVRRRR
jgi:small subunit ribosomal protein S18